jgi:hypothetical protein
MAKKAMPEWASTAFASAAFVDYVTSIDPRGDLGHIEQEPDPSIASFVRC